MKKKFTVYLNHDLAKRVEMLAENQHLYVSQLLANLIQSRLDQVEKRNSQNNVLTKQAVLEPDRNCVDIRLLEIGIESCLLSRKILETHFKDSKKYHETTENIKQESIYFVKQLGTILKKS